MVKIINLTFAMAGPARSRALNYWHGEALCCRGRASPVEPISPCSLSSLDVVFCRIMQQHLPGPSIALFPAPALRYAVTVQQEHVRVMVANVGPEEEQPGCHRRLNPLSQESRRHQALELKEHLPGGRGSSRLT